jgi:hypothetical protein
MRERDIKGIINKLGVVPIPSPCSLDGYTKRAEIKELIRSMRKENSHVFEHLAAAMREGRPMQLWPSELTKEKIRKKSNDFWFGMNE